MRSLRERLAHVPQVGRVAWIGVRPAHGAPMQALHEVELIASRGVAGDCAAAGRAGGKRQVTLIQGEHLPVIAALAGGRVEVTPELLRRNVVVSGVNLLSLTWLRFAVGEEVVLEGTGPCAPCGAMDEALGDGGFQAMRGHGGITARVLRGGVVHVGDVVRALPVGEDAPSAAERAVASSPGEQGEPPTG
ncbi:molybdenum cofactor sulfurase [Sorangium cellulosum]|uniref:Molybdenum cofactor sulfurase n=1 Tax=Sorangium cellulosum TaxID=56 RepID=A0A2L0FAW7_SORCE|nr:MOSC domain-containing protein [Sorangium cellulosum]AUX48730.1 molybdenum cofactor sulfurase [Sorangium cellulosum]